MNPLISLYVQLDKANALNIPQTVIEYLVSITLRNAGFGKYPWQVLVEAGWRHQNATKITGTCGGTLISRQIVVTVSKTSDYYTFGLSFLSLRGCLIIIWTWLSSFWQKDSLFTHTF